jgi:hypothetical protein
LVLYQDFTDVPVEVYGGYNPAIPPQDLPPGASPFCQDVVFPEGSVITRGGLAAQFPGVLPALAKCNGLKTYLTPTLAQRLLAWDSIGNLYKENPQGTLSLVASRPYADLLYQSTTLFGREYQAFFNATGSFDIPRQFDDTFWDRVSQVGPGASPAAVDSATAGNIAAGKHQVSVAFVTRQGFITAASVPPTTWTAAGVKQVSLTTIPIGPPNIVARLLLFTPVITAPATTGSFYSMPTGTTQLATPTVMLINDNTTVNYTVDFTDAILIASFQANYLFSQLELGECAFAAGYNSRLLWLGERNKQSNFINTTFDGGFAQAAPVSTPVGPNSPTVAANGGEVNGIAWANPNNVFVSDGVAATAVLNTPLGGPNAFTQSLKATGYGFAIPSNAIIAGISVTARVKSTGASFLTDFHVFLLKAGVQTGADHKNGNIYTNAFANQVYGSTVDLWGANWTPADINAVNFGVAYSSQNTIGGSADTASLDYISITVSYTTSAAVTNPLGWTQGASFAGGSDALSNSLSADWMNAYSIKGDGATATRGQITQSAFQDYLLQPIIARNTAYRVRARLALSGPLAQGTLHINLQSTTGAFTTAGLSVQANQLTAVYVEFDALITSALISPPTDLLLQIYADGTPTNNGYFLVDSVEIYPTNSPFNYSTARFSHAFNPESYDATTGQVQVRPNDGQQLRAGFPIRNNYYLAKDHYLCYVVDDGVNEPASWPVNEVSATVGICGPNAVDWTEEWAAFAERSGLYLIWGADPVKITPEIQEDASRTGKITWSSINWAVGHTVWVRIDKTNKRILVGAPVNGALTPNVIFVVDYKWLETAQDIANSPMVTYSAFTGKVLSHGRGRRWTYWNITANSMTFAERADGTAQPFFGNGVGNGKIYQQGSEAVQLSDDGVAINGRYDTYYAPSSNEEEAFKLGAHRKLLGYLKWRAIGAGTLLISVQQANRVTNLRGYTLSTFPTGDGGRGLNLHGERFSLQISTNAVGSWFQLEKLIPCIKRDATMVVRGVNA